LCRSPHALASLTNESQTTDIQWQMDYAESDVVLVDYAESDVDLAD